MTMKKSPKDRTRILSKSSIDNFFTAVNEKPSDFWWNFVYFLILTTAIVFVLSNNSVNTLKTTPALIILGLLLGLDIFPAFYLTKIMVRYSRYKNKK